MSRLCVLYILSMTWRCHTCFTSSMNSRRLTAYEPAQTIIQLSFQLYICVLHICISQLWDARRTSFFISRPWKMISSVSFSPTFLSPSGSFGTQSTCFTFPVRLQHLVKTASEALYISLCHSGALILTLSLIHIFRPSPPCRLKKYYSSPTLWIWSLNNAELC